MNTPLPADAPRPYYRAQLGPKTMAYIKRKGWLDRRTVTRLTASGVTREEKETA